MGKNIGKNISKSLISKDTGARRKHEQEGAIIAGHETTEASKNF